MLGDCIIASWQDGVGVFAPSLPIQNLSRPDCQGTRYSVCSLHEAAESDVASRGDGEPCRGRRPAASLTLSHCRGYGGGPQTE